ncbi:hypothetical protein BDN70DRAFT_11594 [Pholiota conissans]|uniref:Uncharacterized protein n=1 Tax=Pholiota conissans TaxID=109636 RepID=A0A9P6D7A5_9AGAR|nr:hypothetical protein BDN70DRAFT_11594 [Pholiota conissans]
MLHWYFYLRTAQLEVLTLLAGAIIRTDGGTQVEGNGVYPDSMVGYERARFAPLQKRNLGWVKLLHMYVITATDIDTWRKLYTYVADGARREKLVSNHSPYGAKIPEIVSAHAGVAARFALRRIERPEGAYPE